jgi:hypothetical protein
MDLKTSAPRFEGTGLLAQPDGPGGAPTGWEGVAENQSGDAATVHVGALCAPDVAVTTVVASVSVGSGTFAGATAECPEDSVAIGGGMALAGLGLVVAETGPRFAGGTPLAAADEGVQDGVPDAWTVFARNPGGGSPLMKVVAICAELDVFAVVGARNTQPNGGGAGGQLDCPGATPSLGGGIASLNPLGLTVTSSTPFFAGDHELKEEPDGTSPAPTGWNGRGRNDSDDFLTVHRAAICVPEVGPVATGLATAATLAGVAMRRRR